MDLLIYSKPNKNEMIVDAESTISRPSDRSSDTHALCLMPIRAEQVYENLS